MRAGTRERMISIMAWGCTILLILMFFTVVTDAKDWGSGAAGSPVMSAPYWFFSSKEPSQMKGLPPILVFLVGVADWSDGTPAGKHND